MRIGVIGLGRMGGNIVRRLQQGGHHCVVFDQQADAVKKLTAEGAAAGRDLKDLVGQLKGRRAIWVMLPSGQVTEDTVAGLGELMSSGDIIIDGGNSFYKDDIRRAQALKAKGIRYVDVGTSGGIWGFERGYCMMIGGDKDAVGHLDPIFATLAPGEGGAEPSPGREGRDPRIDKGYIHCGPSGSGHFVKMVHNGIEYGLMQAYAEGFDILRNADSDVLPAEQRYTLDLPDVAEVWRRGSVIGSWLLDLTAMALAEDPNLDRYEGFVQDSGEGRWTINAAIETAVPVDVLAAALFARFRSRQKYSFANKMLSAMRGKFGGHVEAKAGA